jgi:predicted ATP-grasp superfamily ATP-dependent carboligase
MKILVTNGAYKHTLALVRSLGAAGHEVGVVAHRWAAVSFFSRFCSRRHVVETTEKEAFVDEILAILQKERYDVLLPVGLPTVVWLAERADEIKKFTNMPLADVEKIKLFENKQATYNLSVALNIPTPLSFFPKDRADADICAAKLTPPIVVKHCKKSGADWLKYANTQEEAVNFYVKMLDLEAKSVEKLKTSLRGTKQKNLESKIDENAQNTEGGNSEFKNTLPLQTSKVIARHEAIKLQTDETNILFQEYLSGGGFGFFGLYENGGFKQGFAHKRVREFPVSGGASCCAESIDNEQLTRYGRQILEGVNWHGVAMVEFKMDADGQPRLLEVNPKLWGSFDLSVAAGVPFSEKWTQLALNQPIREHEDYKKGIQFSWLFDGDLKNGLATGKFWQILRGSIFDKKTRTNLSWRDPLATLFLIVSGLRR